MYTDTHTFCTKQDTKPHARLLFNVRKIEGNIFSSGKSTCVTAVEIRSSSVCWILEVLGVSRMTSCSGTLSLVICKQNQSFQKIKLKNA